MNFELCLRCSRLARSPNSRGGRWCRGRATNGIRLSCCNILVCGPNR